MLGYAALIPLLNTLIDRWFPDKNKQEEAKNQMQELLNSAEAERLKAKAESDKAKSNVIVAEAKSQSYAARNWRPHLMYALMLIVPYNYILAPLLMSFGIPIVIYPIPGEFWTLLTVGLGGYIGSDMVTTYSEAKFNDKAFFDILRKNIFPKGMTESQVRKINEAINAGKAKK